MSARDGARAVDALRRGWPIALGALRLLPVETADHQGLAAFEAEAGADVLLAAARAATLKLANQIEAAGAGAVTVMREGHHDLAAVQALADPTRDLGRPLSGPWRAIATPSPADAAAALVLAREAGLLPAFFVGGAGAAPEVRLTAGDVAAYADPARLAIVARAALPVRADERAQIVAFRSGDGGPEHVALLLGTPTGAPPLVRVHSECLTGDALGSLKCDCGPQLAQALTALSAGGWGVLLYLRQEGRGIGLANKLRAYALQDQGWDTVDANLRLGLPVDARDFGVAARMLRLLGQDAVRLLTNNPAKVAGLEAAGVRVVERVPHHLPANPHNARYLDTKRLRTGHQL